MKLTTKVVLVLLGSALIYMCAAATFVLYVVKHPGIPVPRSISIPLFCFFILTIAAVSVILPRMARKHTKTETAEEGHVRRARAVKGWRIGLIVWSLILLNDIRMLLQRTIPLAFAIPGLAIVLFMVFISWLSLKRLQRAEATNVENSQRRASQ
jgi:hypothetical protein